MNTPDIDAMIQATAQRYNLDPQKFRRQLQVESGLNPGKVNPVSGAAGIAQFMPATAQGLGINPMDPSQAIPAAGQYMRQNLNKFGDYDTALAAYNWGPGNVATKGMANIPPETQAYIAKINGGGTLDSGTPDPQAGPQGPQAIPFPAMPPLPAAGSGAAPPTMLAYQDPSTSGLATAFMQAAQRARTA